MLHVDKDQLKTIIKDSALFGDGDNSRNMYNFRTCVGTTMDDDGQPAFFNLEDKLNEDGDFDRIMDSSNSDPQRSGCFCETLFGAEKIF